MPKTTKKLVGKVSHFFDKISVAIIELKAPLKAGDKVSFEGKDEPIAQVVESMQIDKKSVNAAKKGDSIGLKTDQRIKVGSDVYKQ